ELDDSRIERNKLLVSTWNDEDAGILPASFDARFRDARRVTEFVCQGTDHTLSVYQVVTKECETEYTYERENNHRNLKALHPTTSVKCLLDALMQTHYNMEGLGPELAVHGTRVGTWKGYIHPCRQEGC